MSRSGTGSAMLVSDFLRIKEARKKMRNIQTRRLGKLNKEDLEEFNNIF
jgi:hypothetical protein